MSEKKMGRPLIATPSYRAVHLRVIALHGKAVEHSCIACLGPAEDWAYVGDGSDPERMTETVTRAGNDRPAKTVERTYSTDLSQYQPLCKRCHAWFDRPPTCGHGEDGVRRYDVTRRRRNGRYYTETQRRCRRCESATAARRSSERAGATK